MSKLIGESNATKEKVLKKSSESKRKERLGKKENVHRIKVEPKQSRKN